GTIPSVRTCVACCGRDGRTPKNFIAAREQLQLLQCREHKEIERPHLTGGDTLAREFRSLRSLRFTNCRFQRHFTRPSTIFLKSAVVDFVNSFGPVILTNTLPSLASMMAPSSA